VLANRWETIAIAAGLVSLAGCLGVQLVFRVSIARAAEALILAWRDVSTEASSYDLILARRAMPRRGHLADTTTASSRSTRTS
jgi:hypothetical protein